MKTIVEQFISKLNDTASEAYGVYFVIKQGIMAHKQLEKIDPHAKVMIYANNPSVPGRHIKQTTTIRSIYSKLSQNERLIFEIYLSKIIQLWFDFLEDLYKYALTNNLYHKGRYSVPTEKLKIDLSISSEEIKKEIIDKAVENFSFLSAKEKLSRIKKIYNMKTELHDNKDINLININIQIRNIIQHNMGIIQKSDLDILGVNEIEEDEGISKKVLKKEGDKILRTPFDIENLVEAMINSANKITQ